MQNTEVKDVKKAWEPNLSKNQVNAMDRKSNKELLYAS